MTARDYEHDKWIAWYVEDTVGWLQLSLAARGAMAEIARKLNGKGELTLRRGLSSLAFILRVGWEGELEPAVAELIAAGKVTWDGSRFVLADPEYTARKRRGSADRMRDKRARDASDAGDVTSVTPVTVTPVTAVLVSSNLSGSDLSSGSDAREEPTGIRPRAVGPDGECGALFATWTAAIREATGIPQSGLSPGDRRELVAIANTHADGATGQALLDWVRVTAIAFAKVHDPTFGGFVPLQARKWLDGGRRGRARAGPIVQSGDNRAWKLPEGMP